MNSVTSAQKKRMSIDQPKAEENQSLPHDNVFFAFMLILAARHVCSFRAIEATSLFFAAGSFIVSIRWRSCSDPDFPSTQTRSNPGWSFGTMEANHIFMHRPGDWDEDV